MKCKNCGYEISGEAKTCPQCYTPLKKSCLKCGSPLSDDGTCKACDNNKNENSEYTPENFSNGVNANSNGENHTPNSASVNSNGENRTPNSASVNSNGENHTPNSASVNSNGENHTPNSASVNSNTPTYNGIGYNGVYNGYGANGNRAYNGYNGHNGVYSQMNMNVNTLQTRIPGKISARVLGIISAAISLITFYLMFFKEPVAIGVRNSIHYSARGFSIANLVDNCDNAEFTCIAVLLFASNLGAVIFALIGGLALKRGCAAFASACAPMAQVFFIMFAVKLEGLVDGSYVVDLPREGGVSLLLYIVALALNVAMNGQIAKYKKNKKVREFAISYPQYTTHNR